MPTHGSGALLIVAVAAEVERLASHDVDPTDHFPDWLLEALPQPDGGNWLADPEHRWASIIAALRAEAGACNSPAGA